MSYSTHLEGVKFDFPNSYIVLDYQGKGNQGIVVNAHDIKTGQNVAIKKLLSPFDNELSARRTYREIAILNLVKHKNVIELLNVYTPQENLNEFSDVYLVFELMEQPLSNLVRFPLKNPEYHQEHASFIMYQMLCAVNHLHKSGIIHRDLSPDNIVINSNFVLKIVDFGYARSNNSATKTQYVTTRHYRGPEIILGAGYCETADIWSLGCIFAKIFTAQVFFPGNDQIDQWQKIIQKVGTPNSEYFETLSATIKNYVSSQPFYPPQTWEQLLPDLLFPVFEARPDLTGESARDLISKMLVIDPTKRISIREALNHSYVKLWFDNDEINGPPSPPYDLSIDNLDHDVQTWKRLIFNQIKEWQK